MTKQRTIPRAKWIEALTLTKAAGCAKRAFDAFPADGDPETRTVLAALAKFNNDNTSAARSRDEGNPNCVIEALAWLTGKPGREIERWFATSSRADGEPALRSDGLHIGTAAVVLVERKWTVRLGDELAGMIPDTCLVVVGGHGYARRRGQVFDLAAGTVAGPIVCCIIPPGNSP